MQEDILQRHGMFGVGVVSATADRLVFRGLDCSGFVLIEDLLIP